MGELKELIYYLENRIANLKEIDERIGISGIMPFIKHIENELNLIEVVNKRTKERIQQIQK